MSDFREAVLPTFGLNRGQEVDSSFGAIEEKIVVDIDSPFLQDALSVIREARGFLGNAAVEITSESEDLDIVERVQPRPSANETITLNANNHLEVIGRYIGSGVKYCQWLARTGSGKSTFFPMILHERTGYSVLVIEPILTLAANAYSFMKRTKPSSVGLFDTSGFTGAQDGVVYTTAVAAISTLINRPDVFEGFGYIYLDESHFLSGEYYALKVALFDWKEKSRIILASATHGGRTEQDNGIGPVVMMSTCRTVVFEELVNDSKIKEDDPWHFRRISNRWMIFLCSEAECVRVRDYYAAKGIRAGILHENTTAHEYNEIYRTLDASANRPYVLATTAVAETGVTLPVDTVLNLCVVRYLHYDDDKDTFEWAYRWTTDYENKQRAGRVGRMKNGVVYQPSVSTTSFSDMEDSQKIYAYVYLRLLNYLPLKDIFSQAIALIGPLTYKGYSQIASCKLHPAMTRRFMNEDGKFYANYRSALTPFMVNSRRPLMSALSADVSKYKHKGSYTHPQLHNGRSFELRLPFDGNSPVKPIMMHFAFEELRFKSNRGAHDFREDKRGFPERVNRVRRSVLPSANDSRRSTVVDEVNEMPMELINLQPVVEEKVVPNVFRRVEQVESSPVPRTVVRQPVNYTPKTTYSPALLQMARQPSYQEQQQEQQMNLVPYSPPALAVAMPLGSHTANHTIGMAIASFGLVRPSRPFNVTKDFGLWTKVDSELINSMLAGNLVITNMAYERRCIAHDALCVVWNSVFVARTSLDSKLNDWVINKRGPVLFDSVKKKLSKELDGHNRMLAALEVLEESFRSYQHFVVPYSRPL